MDICLNIVHGIIWQRIISGAIIWRQRWRHCVRHRFCHYDRVRVWDLKSKARCTRCDLLYITKSHDTFVSLWTLCNNHILLTFLLFKYNKITCDTKWNRTVFYFKNVACNLKYVHTTRKTPVYTVRLAIYNRIIFNKIIACTSGLRIIIVSPAKHNNTSG